MNKIRRLICKIFGHKWRYAFSPTDALQTENVDIRVCGVCGKTQHWKEIFNNLQETEYVWMNMITYTEFSELKNVEDNEYE